MPSFPPNVPIYASFIRSPGSTRCAFGNCSASKASLLQRSPGYVIKRCLSFSHHHFTWHNTFCPRFQPNSIDIFAAADCHPSPTNWNMKKWQRRHNAIPLHIHPLPPTRLVFFLHQTRELLTAFAAEQQSHLTRRIRCRKLQQHVGRLVQVCSNTTSPARTPLPPHLNVAVSCGRAVQYQIRRPVAPQPPPSTALSELYPILSSFSTPLCQPALTPICGVPLPQSTSSP